MLDHITFFIRSQARAQQGTCMLPIKTLLILILAMITPLMSGCRAVPVYEQQLVSKPSMQFSDSPVFAYGCRALTQIEPGFATSGGAQVTTCSACK